MNPKKTPVFPLWFSSLVLMAGLLGLAACAPPEPLRLGFVGGLSGRVADLGVDGRNGAMLAVEMRNQAGGVKGKQVELLVEDDQQDPDVARKVVSKLIGRKVAAIIGPMTSAMAIATVPLVNGAQVAMISPTVTTNELTGLDDYFFRVLSSTKSYARKSADYHFHNAGLRRVMTIHDLRNKSYTESWLADYLDVFKAAGGHAVGSLSFSSSDETHFADLARNLLNVKPDGILIVANSVDTAMLCQQIRKMNASIPIAASEWAATERLIELGGRAVEGIVIAQIFDRQSTQSAFVEFRRHYLSRYGKEPGFAGLTAFDAANVAMDGLESQVSGQSLKQTLMARKTFGGIQTPVVFDAFGDTVRATYLTTIREAKFVALH